MASHRTVLLAESEPTLLDAVGFALRRRGYHVLTARDADRAIELIARNVPDAIVAGMLLANGGGFRLVQWAQAQAAERLPIVMTAPTAGAHAAFAEAVGIDAFLAQPFTPLLVADAVETLCPLSANTQLRGTDAIPWQLVKRA